MKRSAPIPSLVTAFSLLLVLVIWLTPAFANTLPVFTSLGQLRATGMGTPGAMDLDDAGNLYVADALGRKIYRFDQYGTLTRVYSDGAFKYADRQGLTSGRGLAVTPDGKRLYFAREMQALILDTDTGALVGELTGSGDAPEFKMTGEIDLDANGNVYVVDAGSGRLNIKIYSADGQFQSQFGGVGTVVGTFQSINSMTINGAGQVVVADASPASLSGKVQVFTVDPGNTSNPVTSVVGYAKNLAANFGPIEMHTPRGVVFDEMGRGYFLEYIFSTITVVNSSFQYLGKFNAPVSGQYLQTGFKQGEIAYVFDLMYDKVNKRLFVSCDGGRIEIFSIDGGTSPVYVNTPPTVPAVQSPKDGIIVLTATPTLAYDAATDDKDTATLTYQVVIKQGEGTVHTFAPTTATSVTVPDGLLNDDIVYNWMVQAVDSKGLTSGFSPAAAFVVDTNDPPSVPVVQSPVDGGVLATDSPEAVQTLIFAPATDATDTSLSYQVKIMQAGTEIYATTTTATSVELPAGLLADGGNYSWMVQSVDSKGVASGFSPAAAFVVNVNDPPTVPALQTPVAGVVESDAPVLTYVAATDDNDTTLTYQIVIKQGDVEIYTAETSEVTLAVPAGVLAENAAYSWAVQAVDSKGLVSGFSAPGNFVVNATDEAPTAPELLEPVAEAVMASAGRFAWTTSSDPDPSDSVKLYQVEIATDAAFATVVASALLEGTSLTLGDFADYADLVVGASYFCRVMALDQDETPSEPSAAVAFTYDTIVLTVDAPISGAAVFLGGNLAYSGRPVGVTPLELRDLAPGNYVVTVEAAGFEPYLANVAVGENAKPDVLATLKPAMQSTDFKGAKAINGKPGLKVSAAATPFVIDYQAVNQLDLLVGDATGVVHLFPAIQVAGNGEMTVSAELPAVKQLFQGAVPFVVDWNNNNQNDLLVGLADGTVKLFLDGAAGALVQAGDVPLTVGADAAPLVIDLNRDGLKDLVVGNAAGQVVVCYNTGTDAAPKLAAPVQLFTVGVPVVPTAVDWNADGVWELIVASAKGIAVYSNESGTFVATTILATPAKAVFAVDADGGKGKDLIIGAEDGRLLFAQASSAIYPSAYPQALNAKTDEVEALMVVAKEATGELLAIVAKIREQIAAASYSRAAVQAQNLAAALVNAQARAAAGELAALCVTETLVTTDPGPGTRPGKTSK